MLQVGSLRPRKGADVVTTMVLWCASTLSRDVASAEIHRVVHNLCMKDAKGVAEREPREVLSSRDHRDLPLVIEQRWGNLTAPVGHDNSVRRVVRTSRSV